MAKAKQVFELLIVSSLNLGFVLGRGCSAAVEHSHRISEVEGSIRARLFLSFFRLSSFPFRLFRHQKKKIIECLSLIRSLKKEVHLYQIM